MATIETVHYDSQSVRLVLLDGRWWVFAEDAAIPLDARMSPTELFDEAPTDERLRKSLTAGPQVYLVSARYLIRRLQKSQKFDHSRFRAWLKAWKIVTGVQDRGGK